MLKVIELIENGGGGVNMSLKPMPPSLAAVALVAS